VAPLKWCPDTNHEFSSELLSLKTFSRLLSPEAFGGAGFGLGGFFFAIFGWRRGFKRAQHASRNGSHFVDGGEEQGLVRLRRFVEAGDFPDELKRGCAHFFVGDWRIEVKKSFDVSTHGVRPRVSELSYLRVLLPIFSQTAGLVEINMAENQCGKAANRTALGFLSSATPRRQH
jgi:hypothetical protein